MRECTRDRSALGKVEPAVYWAEAEPLFAEALIGTGECPDTLLARVETGSAIMLASDEAFAILEHAVVEGKVTIILWALVSRTGEINHTALDAALESVAHKVGADQMTCWTSRPGFNRVLPKFGWSIKRTCWTKEIRSALQ